MNLSLSLLMIKIVTLESRTNALFLMLSFSILAMSCAPLYVPNARNIPMFTGAKEFQATASAGMGYNLQAAYAITDHIGVTGNFMVASNKSAKKFQYRTQRYSELGIGFFENHKSVMVEAFVGVGAGKASARDSIYIFLSDDYVYSADAAYTKFFFQPALGMNRWDNFEWSFAPRISYVSFRSLDIYEGTTPIPPSKKNYLYFEPCVNLKISLYEKKFFFVLQSGFNLPLYNDDNNHFNIENFHGVTGLQFRIAPKLAGVVSKR